MRSIILLIMLAVVTLSLAEEKDKEKTLPKTEDKETAKEKKEDKTPEEQDKKPEEQDNKSEDKYTDRFDSINVDELIANRRLLVPYLKCVLDNGRCTPEGKELKAHVKDAMQTACKRCTDKQKTGARKVVNHIKNNEPIYWHDLTQKFDPKGEFKPIYEPFLAGKDPQ